MNLFILSSTLFAFGCLAADKFDDLVVAPHCDYALDNVYNLQNIIMEQHPEFYPPYLVSKCWDIDVATAFAIGLALGKQCNIAKYMHTNSIADLQSPHLVQDNNYSNNNSSSADCVKEESDVDKLTYACKGEENGLQLKVSMKNFQSIISANSEWKNGSNTYNPFDKLFKIKEIQNPDNYGDEAFLYLGEVRHFFAEHAKCATAMIAIDVAILKFLVHAINTRPQEDHLIVMDGALIMPICALSMHVQVREHCKDDIRTVLNHIQHSEKAYEMHLGDEKFATSLLTAFKFLDDGSIRTMVGEIITKIAQESIDIDGFVLANSMMLLEADHSFLVTTAEEFSDDDADDEIDSHYNTLDEEMNLDRKFHSIGNMGKPGIMSTCFPYHELVIALIEPDDSLKWEVRQKAQFGKCFELCNVIDPNSKQRRLFIINQLPVPQDFLKECSSCTSLPEFLKYLENLTTRRMILTFGIIILENNSKVMY